MAGLTPTGLEIKRLSDILISLQEKARTAYGSTVNLSDDSVLGQLLTIVAAEYADLWEGTQGVYNARYPRTAEGINLDNVADLVNIERLSAQKSTVSIVFTGTPTTVVESGTLVEQIGSGNQYLTTSALTLTTSAFNRVTINVTTVSNLATYTVTIAGTPVSYNSDASATNLEIAAGLVSAINLAALGCTATDNLNGSFTIICSGIEEKLLSFDVKLTATSVGRVVGAEATVTGPVDVDANTITILKTPNFGISSINNPVSGLVGRNEETDSELRLRRFESVAIVGNTTVDAIRARLRQIDGVTAAFVVENKTLTTDGEGRPGKSYECIVQGGTNEDIAQVIWDSKPAGIETYGDITESVLDVDGITQSVKFSRPDILYIHVNVVYELYNEEIFPAGGEDAIKQAIVDYGNSIGIGTDVINQRFLGPIYSTVPGIGLLTITMATSLDGITPGAYSSNNIPIAPLQLSDWNISRVAVSEAP